MKKIILLFIMISFAFNTKASALKTVDLEKIECYFNKDHSEYCVLFVRDIYNTTGLGLIYQKTDKLIERISVLRSQVFYLDTKFFKLLPQAPLKRESYFDKNFFFVEALDNGDASLNI